MGFIGHQANAEIISQIRLWTLNSVIFFSGAFLHGIVENGLSADYRPGKISWVVNKKAGATY